jgi:hypothetical protein
VEPYRQLAIHGTVLATHQLAVGHSRLVNGMVDEFLWDSPALRTSHICARWRRDGRTLPHSSYKNFSYSLPPLLSSSSDMHPSPSRQPPLPLYFAAFNKPPRRARPLCPPSLYTIWSSDAGGVDRLRARLK